MDRMKQKSVLPGSLKCSTAAVRLRREVPPSRRWNVRPRAASGGIADGSTAVALTVGCPAVELVVVVTGELVEEFRLPMTQKQGGS